MINFNRHADQQLIPAAIKYQRYYGFEIQKGSFDYAKKLNSEFKFATFIYGDATPSLSCAYEMVTEGRYEDLFGWKP